MIRIYAGTRAVLRLDYAYANDEPDRNEPEAEGRAEVSFGGSTIGLIFLSLFWTTLAWAGPLQPSDEDVFGWQLPRLISIDTFKFPRRLVRNRSYGRVVVEIILSRNGSQQDIEFTHIDNGDLKRWAIKILKSAKFDAGRLDGSPLSCRVPAHVVFIAKSEDSPARYEVWLPSDSANYRLSLLDHFLEINDGLAPILARAGSYSPSGIPEPALGTVSFEVYVNKDGSREEGRVIYSPHPELTRNALTALVGLKILPPRYRNRSYGCWTRVLVGFCADWEYPTQPVERTQVSYRGWPSPSVVPVLTRGQIAPQFIRVDSPPDRFDSDLMKLSSSLVQGHALFYARIDTSGAVAEWFRARGVNKKTVKTDFEYLLYVSSRMNEPVSEEFAQLNYVDRARLSAQDLERIMPYLIYSPARDILGQRIEMWVLVTPAIFR